MTARFAELGLVTARRPASLSWESLKTPVSAPDFMTDLALWTSRLRACRSVGSKAVPPSALPPIHPRRSKALIGISGSGWVGVPPRRCVTALSPTGIAPVPLSISARSTILVRHAARLNLPNVEFGCPPRRSLRPRFETQLRVADPGKLRLPDRPGERCESGKSKIE